MAQNGICKFCGQEKKLINSHVIPKCFYNLKEWGRMARFAPKTKQIDWTRHQNGWKEPLMCEECDSRFGVLDNYANKILFDVIPKHDLTPIYYGLAKECRLHRDDFNYNKLRRFFISLIWRVSISKNHPPSLGMYENIALRILNYEAPDNETLFLPLIYRKSTNPFLDYITGVSSDDFLGQHNYRFRFINYEIIVITDTKKTNDRDLTNDLKQMFTRDEIVVIESDGKTSLDLKYIEEMTDMKDEINRIGYSRGKIVAPELARLLKDIS